MKKQRDKRWRFWADKTIQGRLVARIAVYWVVCQLATVVTMFAMSFLLQGSPTAGSGSIWSLIVPALTVSTLVLPFALFDAVVFSNRFAGPMMRFRRHFAELADTGSAKEMSFRPTDFYGDLSDNFNKLCQKADAPDSNDGNESTTSGQLPMLHMTSPIGSEAHA
jgi:hypothetical protein